ncbi:MAG: DUF72 domain-containing protein [Alphaproteobacteria bacterium]|uniref:DUF72 domain-containing protein n=1 Tax=Candidatus Nitrobium versatile TaxID=2884831 RepID=A0A953J5H2_9BACT|nr:DUF72 domain-containing protein [Candidatus Nitrobium versatile]
MIRVGTASWVEKTLVESGEFYPREVSTAEERLRFYAGRFTTVEVDSTYYSLPSMRNASLWVARTPGDFIFHIKAYGALTGHGIDPKTLPKDIRGRIPVGEQGKRYIYIKDSGLLKEIGQRFREALLPLTGAGKMGVLVFQFPPWFLYKTSNLDYLLACKELMGELPVAVEFRHGSWLAPNRAEPVFRFLEENGLSYITTDEPQFDSFATIPFLPRATTDIAYFRFHGRNKENWLKKGIDTSLRYDYFYSDDELKGFIAPLRKIDTQVKVTYALFNNCHGSSAVRNARRMKEMLEGE